MSLEDVRADVERVRSRLAEIEEALAAIATVYMHEVERRGRSPEQRLRGRVRRLLAGELFGPAQLGGYELDGRWHLGVIAKGTGAQQALRVAAAGVGQRLLSISDDDEAVLAWFGGRRELAAGDIERVLPQGPAEMFLAGGEPGWGVSGLRVTRGTGERGVGEGSGMQKRLPRYADVAPLAPWLHDDALARSFIETHLPPLDDRRNEQALRQTLRAYFAAGRNAKAAAVALKIDRGTVAKRLRTIEQRLGCPLHERLAGLEIALDLEELYEARNGTGAPSRA
jgi:hypothetical protein